MDDELINERLLKDNACMRGTSKHVANTPQNHKMHLVKIIGAYKEVSVSVIVTCRLIEFQRQTGVLSGFYRWKFDFNFSGFFSVAVKTWLSWDVSMVLTGSYGLLPTE